MKRIVVIFDLKIDLKKIFDLSGYRIDHGIHLIRIDNFYQKHIGFFFSSVNMIDRVNNLELLAIEIIMSIHMSSSTVFIIYILFNI